MYSWRYAVDGLPRTRKSTAADAAGWNRYVWRTSIGVRRTGSTVGFDRTETAHSLVANRRSRRGLKKKKTKCKRKIKARFMVALRSAAASMPNEHGKSTVPAAEPSENRRGLTLLLRPLCLWILRVRNRSFRFRSKLRRWFWLCGDSHRGQRNFALPVVPRSGLTADRKASSAQPARHLGLACCPDRDMLCLWASRWAAIAEDQRLRLPSSGERFWRMRASRFVPSRLRHRLLCRIGWVDRHCEMMWFHLQPWSCAKEPRRTTPAKVPDRSQRMAGIQLLTCELVIKAPAPASSVDTSRQESLCRLRRRQQSHRTDRTIGFCILPR